jgi:hypothetical protein
MYVQLAAAAVTADALALETCGAAERPRQALALPRLDRISPAPDSGPAGSARRSNSSTARCMNAGERSASLSAQPVDDVRVPVAGLRVFLFVPDEHLESIAEKIAVEPQEYLLPHSAFNNQ